MCTKCLKRLLAGSSPKEYKNTNWKGYTHPSAYGSVICNRPIMEAAHVSFNWSVGEGVVYNCTMEYYLAIKKTQSCHLQQPAWI